MELRLAKATTAVEADLPAIAELLSDVFGSDRDWKGELVWQYLQNPSGRAIYVNAYDEKAVLVAHYAVIPTSPLAEPAHSSIKTYLSLNTAVRPTAQGKGLFKNTAKALYEYLEELGEHIVIGVANENSVHGFISSLGFYLLGQLKLEAFAPAMSPRPQAPRLLSCSLETIQWRLSKPAADYRKTRHDQVICNRNFRGIPVQCILSAGNLSLVADSNSLKSMKTARRAWPAIYATYGPTNRFAWLVPETLRPSPFHLICRPYIKGSPLSLLNHIQNRRFELFDFDVV